MTIRKTGEYDICVVGAGHNGLVAAILLRRHSLNVCLIEAADIAGGACRATTEFGERVNWGANFLFMLFEEVIHDTGLQLSRLNLTRAVPEAIYIQDPTIAPAQRPDTQKPAIVLSNSSGHWAKYEAERDSAARIFRKHLLDLNACYETVSAEISALALSSGTMFLDGSLSDVGRFYFGADEARIAQCLSGKVLSMYRPSDPGSAVSLLYLACANTRRFGHWSVPATGMSSVTDELSRMYLAAGGALLCNRRVKRLHGCGRNAQTAELADGSRVAADRFVLMVPPMDAASILSDNLPEDCRRTIVDEWSGSVHDGGCSKLIVAADRPLRFVGVDPAVHRGTMFVRCRSAAELEEAFSDAETYGHSRNPYFELFPVTEFALAARPGRYVYSVYLMYSSYTRLSLMSESERADAKIEVFKVVGGFISNPSDVAWWRMCDPIDLEMRFGLTRGNVDHGKFSADRVFDRRRNKSLDACFQNVVVSGPGQVAGGLVTGLPGLLAARRCMTMGYC